MMNPRDDEHHVRQAAKSFIPDRSTRKGFLCLFANTIINHPLWIIVFIAVIFVFPTPSIIAQTDQRCFPETSQCIAGPIRVSWERGGGLTVFGFPITAQTAETVERRTLQVQWFERDRLEIQPDGTVTAGRLGAERLEQLGTPWTPGPNAPAGPGCTTVPETGHQLCEPFATFWRKNGGLARFGLPLTDAFETTLEGKSYTVQYFERRRFELHPEVGPNVVLLGLLGREVFTARQSQPQPVPAPQPSSPPALPAPSYNNCQADPNPGAAPNYPVKITAIDKGGETVTLQNVSPEPVNLDGWIMCSIKGNQHHDGIGGTLAVGEQHTFGHSGDAIWNNSSSDPGALYNVQGQLVSYWND